MFDSGIDNLIMLIASVCMLRMKNAVGRETACSSPPRLHADADGHHFRTSYFERPSGSFSLGPRVGIIYSCTSSPSYF